MTPAPVDLETVRRANTRPKNPELEAALIKTDKGVPTACAANLITILNKDDPWREVLAWNEFSQAITFSVTPPWYPDDAGAHVGPGEISDTDVTRTQSWFSKRWGISPRPPETYAAIRVVADKRVIHPPRDWLLSLKWDGVKRLPTWLSTFLGAEDTPRHRAIGTYWLVAAIARLMKPGCKVDCVMILEGPQGARKSSALKILFDPWFSDTPLDLHDKDRFVGLRGVWCIEMAELDSFARADASRIKSFLSSPTDHYRPPYGRGSVHVPRSVIFAGSTNEAQYVRDSTGARRFWPVRCGITHEIDLAGLELARDLLMAEAREMYGQGPEKGGSHWWPTKDEDKLFRLEVRDRMPVDPWTEAVSDFALAQKQKLGFEAFVTVADVLTDAIEMKRDKWTQGEETRVGRILSGLDGWERAQRRVLTGIEDGTGNGRAWGYLPVRPPTP